MLTFSRPKSFASAAETIGSCSTTTGAGAAEDGLCPNGIHFPMAMLFAQEQTLERAVGGKASRTSSQNEGEKRRSGRGLRAKVSRETSSLGPSPNRAAHPAQAHSFPIYGNSQLLLLDFDLSSPPTIYTPPPSTFVRVSIIGVACQL